MPRTLKRLDRPTTLPTTPHHDERGQVAFGFMLLMVVVFMFFALAVDTGIWALDHRTAQNQVDAAAHAGALALMDGGNADTAARQAFADNGIGDPAGNLCPSDTGDYWIRVDGDAQRVEVCQRRPSEVIFSALTGVVNIQVSARAAAEVVEESSPYALMAMSESACPAVNLQNGSVVIIDGSTYTRSSCTGPQGAIRSNGGTLTSEGNHVVGNPGGGCPTCIDPQPTSASWLADPLMSVPQPVRGSLPRFNSTPPVGTLSPGVYASTLSIGNGDTITLSTGVYILENGLNMTGGMLQSNGPVVIFSTCRTNPPNSSPSGPCNGSRPGRMISITGGSVALTGHPDYANVVFWIDRTSQVHTQNRIQLAGGVDMTLTEGIIYAIRSGMEVTGQGTVITNTPIIVNDFFISSQNATFHVNWDEEDAIKINQLALVE